MTDEQTLIQADLAPEDMAFTQEEWDELMPRAPLRPRLEHSLATGFIKLQKERNPAARQAQWVELQRLATEIERLGQ